ncbi:MAG: Na/Pi cotransporter family protein [Oscillospiraceae bacterium]|nr:Na/Pi cotransporter family protein [Oscillospiraceae bacterium]
MSIFNVFTLMGGLALFMYGMDIMGKALEKAAGSKLSAILSKMTASPLRGFLLGLGVTAVIQSSSATTVMVVGFVNSGIMTLKQAIGIIMGANVGTTVTAWLISLTGLQGDSLLIKMLKPSSFAPVLAFIGLLMYMGSKKDKKKNIGVIMLGFTILMTGMDMMSGAVEPLSEMPWFQQLFVTFSNPIIGVLVGAIVTAVIQSSSASVGILQALSTTGAVTFGSALPIIMGQNIGTCITAILSSFGTTKNAKRTAAVHLYFNITGVIVCMTLFYTLNSFMHFEFVNGVVDQRGIAIVHTCFNIITTSILLPCSGLLEKLAIMTIKDDMAEEEFAMLDERLLLTPSVAVERSKAISGEMADIALDGFVKATAAIAKYSDELFDEISGMEKHVDKYEDKLGTYLVQLSEQDMTSEDNHEVSKILHVINYFERISDYSVNVVHAAREMQEKAITFSGEAMKEIDILKAATLELTAMTKAAFKNNDIEVAEEVEPLQHVINELIMEIKNNHISRLKNKECTIELGFVLSDVLNAYERGAAHCSNIAIAVLESEKDIYAPHESSRSYRKDERSAYQENYAKHKAKYTTAKV